MMNIVLSVLMLVGMALSIGALILWRRGNGRRGLLMLVAALIMFANVVILVAPVAGGPPPVTESRVNAVP